MVAAAGDVDAEIEQAGAIGLRGDGVDARAVGARAATARSASTARAERVPVVLAARGRDRAGRPRTTRAVRGGHPDGRRRRSDSCAPVATRSPRRRGHGARPPEAGAAGACGGAIAKRALAASPAVAVAYSTHRVNPADTRKRRIERELTETRAATSSPLEAEFVCGTCPRLPGVGRRGRGRWGRREGPRRCRCRRSAGRSGQAASGVRARRPDGRAAPGGDASVRGRSRSAREADSGATDGAKRRPRGRVVARTERSRAVARVAVGAAPTVDPSSWLTRDATSCAVVAAAKVTASTRVHRPR